MDTRADGHGEAEQDFVRPGRILDAGYMDSLKAVRGAEADTTYSFTTEHPGQRVYYIFTFGIEPGRMKDAWVLRDPKAKDASDHFPVGLEIV